MAAVVLVAYAIAARADFAIGSGHVVPTQVFLVPLFVLAPAPLVPALVFVGLAVGLIGEAATGRSRLDRLAFCGGDSIYALGDFIVHEACRVAARLAGDRRRAARCDRQRGGRGLVSAP